MICNVAKFVQWPEAIMARNNGQLVVTILGEDELAADMASVLSTRSVNGKPVFVRFVRRVQDAGDGQILYIASSQMGHAAEILAALRGQPVLTLADVEGFAARGGMLDFSGTWPSVRVEIALARAEQSGLHVSSRLLAIARVVDSAQEAAR